MKLPSKCIYCGSRLQGDSVDETVWSCMEDKCLIKDCGYSSVCYSLSYKPGAALDDVESLIIITNDYVIRYHFEEVRTYINKNSGGWYDEILHLNYLAPIEYDLSKLNNWAKELHKIAAFS